MPPPRLPKWMPAQTYRPMTERFKQYISTVALASALALYPAMTSAEELGVDSAADIRTASFTDAPSETSRPVTGCYSLEFGRRSVVSQYLAPVTYAGTRYAVSGRWEKCMPFAPQSAMMAFEVIAQSAPEFLDAGHRCRLRVEYAGLVATAAGICRVGRRRTGSGSGRAGAA